MIVVDVELVVARPEGWGLRGAKTTVVVEFHVDV